MSLRLRSLRTRSLLLFALIPLLILSACGANGNGGGSNTTSNPNANIKLTVGGKLDNEAQILTKMYTLVLRDAGFQVVEKPAFGNNTLVSAGIKSGALDLYPEFTASGLDALKLQSSLDDQKDYQTVKEKFEQQFKITWLDYSPLNDTYAICADKAKAQQLGLTTISDLPAKASQLTMALPSDSLYVLSYLKSTYGITQNSFKKLDKVDYAIGFQEVKQKQADLAFCYSTDLGIVKNNFVVLTDSKHAFPAYHPAPIVRDSTLAKSPDIKTSLNKLAPYITTDVSLSLQKQVSDKIANNMSEQQAIKLAVTDFLKSKGFCNNHGCS